MHTACGGKLEQAFRLLAMRSIVSTRKGKNVQMYLKWHKTRMLAALITMKMLMLLR